MTLPYSVQGGYKNYHRNPGKVRNVELPENWQSGPGEPTTHPAFITEEEQAALRELNLHGKPDPSEIGSGFGPGGLPSFDGAGSGEGFSEGEAPAAAAAAAAGTSTASQQPATSNTTSTAPGEAAEAASEAAQASETGFSSFGDAPSASGFTSATGWTAPMHEAYYGFVPMTDSLGVPVSADTTSGMISSGMTSDTTAPGATPPGAYGLQGQPGWQGYFSDLADSYDVAVPVADISYPHTVPLPPEIDTTDMTVAQINALAAELGTTPSWSDPLGPLAHAMTNMGAFNVAEQAAEEANSTFSDTVMDFLMGENQISYDEQGFPYATAHSFNPMTSGLLGAAVTGFLGPVAGGLFGAGRSIANDDPAGLGLSVLGGLAAPGSAMGVGTGLASMFGLGDDMSFSDVSPDSIATGFSDISDDVMADVQSYFSDPTAVAANDFAGLVGGSGDDTFGENIGTSPVGEVGGGGLEPMVNPQSLFTLLGEQLVDPEDQWYAGKSFFDTGEEIDIGENYGLA